MNKTLFSDQDVDHIHKMIDIFVKTCLETKDIKAGIYFAHRIDCIINNLGADFMVVFP